MKLLSLKSKITPFSTDLERVQNEEKNVNKKNKGFYMKLLSLKIKITPLSTHLERVQDVAYDVVFLVPVHVIKRHAQRPFRQLFGPHLPKTTSQTQLFLLFIIDRF